MTLKIFHYNIFNIQPLEKIVDQKIEQQDGRTYTAVTSEMHYPLAWKIAKGLKAFFLSLLIVPLITKREYVFKLWREARTGIETKVKFIEHTPLPSFTPPFIPPSQTEAQDFLNFLNQEFSSHVRSSVDPSISSHPLTIYLRHALLQGNPTDYSLYHLNAQELTLLYRLLNAYCAKHQGALSTSLTAHLQAIHNHMRRLCSTDPQVAENLFQLTFQFKGELDSLIDDLQAKILAHKKFRGLYTGFSHTWHNPILEQNGVPMLALGAKPLQNLHHHESLTAHYRAFVSVVEEHELRNTYAGEFSAATPEQLKENGAIQLHLPTVDMTPSTLDHIRQGVAFIHNNIQQGKPVYVHCAAGIGRSPLMVSCYLLKHKRNELNLKSFEEAIAYVKSKRPDICLNSSQRARVKDYWEAEIKPFL